jgi:hypothetical protein
VSGRKSAPAVHKWTPMRWIGRTVLPRLRLTARATHRGTRTAAGLPRVSCVVDPRSSARRAAPRTTTAATAATNWALIACARTSTLAVARASRSQLCIRFVMFCFILRTGC